MNQDPEQKILCVISKLLEEYELCPDDTRQLVFPFDHLRQHCKLEYHQVENILKKLQQEGLIENFEHSNDTI